METGSNDIVEGSNISRDICQIYAILKFIISQNITYILVVN